MDQAHHFGALGASAGGSGRGQAGEDFREGLDGTERECTSLASFCVPFLTISVTIVFALAQESAKLTKQWFESSDKAKR